MPHSPRFEIFVMLPKRSDKPAAYEVIEKKRQYQQKPKIVEPNNPNYIQHCENRKFYVARHLVFLHYSILCGIV